ncbi:hypothetical protein HWQ46_02225 [Shewanella sp. D64]|uniref:hypothetical protein n=1 Tax=unclassified Shewanella TaxID=196818 RepID=UPI0022BA360E|nr:MULTISPECIES: hypothetical protein [unclassified Shewanella]MEC4724364.1 hypothetical protein [Shewanella sp. D64]MEC4738876.1 hypothetical protein [Shewanella sp. E94]WBJ97687.1 hypothetical protein HWQ47_11630 [Shewanella sp. MTB7]
MFNKYCLLIINMFSKLFKYILTLSILTMLFNVTQVTAKDFASGLILRGKTSGSYCDIPRGHVDGGYCQIHWKDLEPAQRQLNFFMIENALIKAAEYNEENNRTGQNRYKVFLRIVTGISSPDWVKEQVGSIPWHFRDTRTTDVLPLFWEVSYQDLYASMMHRLGVIYDGNDLVGGVAGSMCMTKFAETMWNRTGRPEVRSININRMVNAVNPAGNRAGYNNNKNIACLKRQIRIHKNKWKTTPTYLGTHFYQKYSLITGNATNSPKITREIFDYCRRANMLGERCVLGNHSLTDNRQYEGTIYALLREYGEPLYYQTEVFLDGRWGNGKTFTYQDLISTLSVGAQWDGHLIELPMWWDCEDVHNKTDCSNALADERSSGDLDSGRRVLKANRPNPTVN